MSFGETSDDTSSEQEPTTCIPTFKCQEWGCNKKSHEACQESSDESDFDLEDTNHCLNKYKCTESGCTATFRKPQRLQDHIKGYHKGEKAYNCTYNGCNKAYTTLNHLKRHRMSEHNNAIVNDHSQIYSEEPAPKRKKIDKKIHKCPEPGCEAIFARPYRLQNHLASQHKNQKPFKCNFEDCDKSYTNHSHLKRHKIISHLSDEDFSKEIMCPEEGCGLVCANKFSLKKHITARHTELLFECNICQEKFKRKSLLHTHKIELHNEKAPYQCNQCDRNFVQSHLHKKHIKQHKTHVCDCNKTFDKWTEYLKHKKTDCEKPNTTYKCAICSKTFTLKQNLTVHCLKVHVPDSQMEEYRCMYLDCGRSYKYKKNLNVHIKNFHEKLFEYIQCTYEDCETVLKTKKNLTQHLKLCHSGKTKKNERRKARKDKGIPKKSTAAIISGLEVSPIEHKNNIGRNVDNKNECEINGCTHNDVESDEKSTNVESAITNNCLTSTSKSNEEENTQNTVVSLLIIQPDHNGANNVISETNFPELNKISVENREKVHSSDIEVSDGS